MVSTEVCVIPIRVDHLPASVRREAAFWCVERYGNSVDVMRPMTVKYSGPNPCNEIGMVACFWFAKQTDANWFALRWL